MDTTKITKTGISAIEETFARTKAEGRALFMPFWTVGYPDLPTSIDMIVALAEAGADVIEVGVPFSDPMAEGPTVQHSSQVALEQGTRVSDCIQAVREVRKRGIEVPLVLMGYTNPYMAYGFERFCRDAADAGGSGLIVADLPPEESAELAGYCETNGLALVPFVAPTSSVERIREVMAHARGFIYMVSVTGVTGARDALPVDLEAYIQRVRSVTDLPLAIGFGVSQPDQVRMLSKVVEGVIVGSAVIRAMLVDGPQAVRDLAVAMRAACEPT
jgi:tryptophan synthase alpha chain